MIKEYMSLSLDTPSATMSSSHLPMLPTSFSFVDVETTGTSARFDRIIEIGILRIENNQVVDQFSTLLNPQRTFDPFITSLTGITNEMLVNAPTFSDVVERVSHLFSDTIFVAHNANFDYSFIKSEFQRLERSFTMKCLCSVKLSRMLFPRFKRHNLDALIERFNLSCTNRHRAFDDAKVIWDFYQASIHTFGQEKLDSAIARVMKRPSLPIGISEDVLDALPECPGVYIFYNKENAPLYIGKSVNIRDRVLSHFSNSKVAPVDMKIAQDITSIETIPTAGELGALLLEATLVKQRQPLLNRQLRYAFKLITAKKTLTGDGYSATTTQLLSDIDVSELENILGIFKSNKQMKNMLLEIAKEYTLCLKLLGLEKTNRFCFNYYLGACNGACMNKENPLKYNLRFEEAFYKTKIKRWPFAGPIAIKEKRGGLSEGLSEQKEEVFVVDKWCVLGSLQHESDSLATLAQQYSFDTDTYRILSRYLRSAKDLSIIPLSPSFAALS